MVTFCGEEEGAYHGNPAHAHPKADMCAGGIAASRIHLRRKEEEMFPNQPFSVCTVWTTQPRKSLGTTLDLDELLLLRRRLSSNSRSSERG